MRFFVFVRYALCSLLILVFLPCGASAQGILSGISGFLDSGYTFFSTKSTDSSGVTTKSTSNTFNDRLSLNINTSIFPNLRLDAGGLFERDLSLTKIGGTDGLSTTTKWRPYFNLTLSNPLYTAGIGYSRREETERSRGSPSVTLVNDEYNAILGWRPEGLPSLDMLYQRRNTFDEEHSFRYTTQDYASLSSRYVYKNLEVRYTGSYSDTADRISNLETQDMLHTGRVSYSNYFLNKRVSFNGSYNITYDQLTFAQKSRSIVPGGQVRLPIFPFAGLSTVDATVNPITLGPNPALIDGDFTASSGINLGVPPPGDTRRRQIGLDFLNVTEVNQLLVWVDRELPSAIATFFSWELFTSPDNVNWTSSPITSVTFGPFQNRFEINFVNVNTRFIRVMAVPLTAAAAALEPTFTNPDRIFVTELQASRVETVSEIVENKRKSTTTTLSHILETDVKTRIFDTPLLYYDLSYFWARSDTEGSAQTTWTLSNGLSMSHALSRVFSVTARVAREDGAEANEKRFAYVYNASIMAVPLRTLRHSLVYGGRYEDIDGERNSTNSVYLNNTAELYKGLDVNVGGGFDWGTKETGQRTQSTRINFGTSIIPHPRMTLTLNYSDTSTQTSGGGRPDSSNFSRVGDFTLSYNPFDTVRLLASLGIFSEKGRKSNLIQNYGINWSPFPEGNLQFNINYNESLRSEDNARERSFIPSVRWKITRRAYLDLSYLMLKSRSASQRSNTDSFNASLKVFF